MLCARLNINPMPVMFEKHSFFYPTGGESQSLMQVVHEIAGYAQVQIHPSLEGADYLKGAVKVLK